MRKEIPGQQLEGIRRLRQSQRKQAQHGACRRRLGVLCRLPTAQLGDRHQAHPGAVHRHRAGDERDAAGTVDYDCDPILGPLPHVRAGTVKALAIATKKRSPALPDVPTSFEQGLPEFDCAPFYAVFAPKGTPKEIVDKLADALSKGLDEPAVRTRLRASALTSPNRSGRGPKALRPREERGGAADADPEGGGGEVDGAASRSAPSRSRHCAALPAAKYGTVSDAKFAMRSPSPRRRPPAPRAAGRSGGGIP